MGFMLFFYALKGAGFSWQDIGRARRRHRLRQSSWIPVSGIIGKMIKFLRK